MIEGSAVQNGIGSAPFQRWNLFALPLGQEIAHDGTGFINAVRIVTGKQLTGGADQLNYLDYAELPPGTSIGDHRHAADEEEFYLVLSGSGLMRLEDDTFAVAAGDLVRNPPGGLHGLANTGAEPLRLFVFELAVRGEIST